MKIIKGGKIDESVAQGNNERDAVVSEPARAKSARAGKRHELDELLDQKIERGARRTGFAPTSQVDESPREGDQLLWLDVDLIDDSLAQARTTYPEDAQAQMVRDMNRDGQLQPAGVRPHPDKPGRWQLIWGHRRKYAVKSGALFPEPGGAKPRQVYANAGVNQPEPARYIGKLWCVVRQGNEGDARSERDLDARRQTWKENASRLDISPLDAARFFVDTKKALSEARGRPASLRDVARFLDEDDHTAIARYTALLNLPEATQKAIESGEIGERHGRALLMLKTQPAAQRSLLRDIQKNALSGAAAERAAKERLALLQEKAPTFADRRAQAEQVQQAREGADEGETTEENRVAQERRAAIGLASADAVLPPKQLVPPVPATPIAAPDRTGLESAIGATYERLVPVIQDNLHRAKISLETATSCFDDTQVAPEDFDEYNAQIAVLERLVKRLRARLNSQKATPQ